MINCTQECQNVNNQEQKQLAQEIARAQRGSVPYQVFRAILIVAAVIGVLAVILLAQR